jgi:cytochrome P450
VFERYHPLRPIISWWNNRRMLQYIWRELDLRFKSKYRQSEVAKRVRSKTIIDLALDNYLAGKAQNDTSGDMDSIFRDFATSQIRTFVFAGHDSTSSTMCYALHLLSTYPTARRLLIAEHDRVLGPDCNQAATQISESPRLLNQLHYTLAVVKETLRLYPPASSTRSGEPGYSISRPDGLQLPTDGFLVWSNSYAIHRNVNYWPEPDSFLPERWLVNEGDRLYPLKGVYRPFEFGPRNCIGQELAMLELKIVLAMTAREFDIRSVYDEWDRLHPTQGLKTLNGDRAYQILSGAAHPSDGLPCRVSLAAH